MEIHRISTKRYTHTILWAVLGSCIIVAVIATLGRAGMNFNAALSDKPDIAIYMLLPDEEIRHSEVLRDNGIERHYLAETKDGPKLVILKRGPHEWFVSSIEKLHE